MPRGWRRMYHGRGELIEALAEYASPFLQVEAVGDGWPVFASVDVGRGNVPVALYPRRVHGARNPRERRIQLPGRSRGPLNEHPGRVSLLVGVWDSDERVLVPHPVLYLPEVARRVGRHTEASVFVPLDRLVEASANGIASEISKRGERRLCVRAPLLPLAVSALACGGHLGDASSGHRDNEILRMLLEESETGATGSFRTEQVRRMARAERFRRMVLTAYKGRCAMCGLGLDLVEAAHVLPVAAKEGIDDPSNGIALCANHHRVFDRHRLGVAPDSLELIFEERFRERAGSTKEGARFIDATFARLRLPNDPWRLDLAMFERRYEHFSDHYGWLRSQLQAT